MGGCETGKGEGGKEGGEGREGGGRGNCGAWDSEIAFRAISPKSGGYVGVGGQPHTTKKKRKKKEVRKRSEKKKR